MVTAPEPGSAWTSWQVAKVASTSDGKTLLKRSMNEITQGAAFKGSPRSVQFLEYVISQAAAGRTDDLKERTIGVELFGRPPTYDTGQDAIVRVTASDVRKRLGLHYSGAGAASEFRINLPLGGYAPELIRVPKFETDVSAHQPPLEEITLNSAGPETELAEREGYIN
jgi:hypothetical protein